MVVCSLRVENIFSQINKDVIACYDLANRTKLLGYDPDDSVKIPLARNMAERVEGLISSVAPEVLGKGILARIQELEQQYGSQDWKVALVIAEEVAKEKFCQFSDKKRAIEIGIRTGFAYVTVGVVSSPLEGFIEIKFRASEEFKKSDLPKDYPYENCYFIIVSKKHIKCITYAELIEGKEVTPTSKNYLGSRKEFDLDKDVIIDFCDFAVKFFSEV